jgi:hypothetical protein
MVLADLVPKEWLDFLGQGWVGTTATIVGTIVAIVASIIAGYVISVRIARGAKPRLVYQARATPIISETMRQELPRDVAIAYGGVPINQLSRSEIVVWNAGGSTLKGSDVVETDQLRWEVSDGVMLHTRLQTAKRTVTNCLFRQDGRSELFLSDLSWLRLKDYPEMTQDTRFAAARTSAGGRPLPPPQLRF